MNPIQVGRLKQQQRFRSTMILLGAFGVFITTNLLGFIMANIVLDAFLPENLRESFILYIDSLQNDSLMTFLNLGPFPLVATIMFFYFRPLVASLNQGGAKEKMLRLAQRRIINAPMVFTVFSLGSWILSLSVVQVYLEQAYQDILLAYRFRAIIVFSVSGIFSGIMSFSLFDYLSRKWYIPWFFPGRELTKVVPWFVVSLARRELVNWLGIGLFPIILMVVLISGLDLWEDVRFLVLSTSLFLALMSFILARLSTRILSLSLDELVHGIKKIQTQDFEVQVPLRSHDEVGILAQGVNQLSHALKTEAQLQRTLGQVVDPKVRDHLLSHPDDWGTQTLEAAVMFCDIRGFTKFSSTRQPQEVTQALNRFFTQMEPIIAKHHGHINKYLGDAFMAVFGAPSVIQNPGHQGLAAAIDIFQALDPEDPFNLAIGLHCGPVLAGAVGSENRREYTVIGDTVNAASRLESLAKEQHVGIVFSQDCLSGEEISSFLPQAGAHSFIPFNLGPKELRGRENPLHLWTLDYKKKEINPSKLEV